MARWVILHKRYPHHEIVAQTNPVLETFFKGYEEQQAMMLLRSNEETYEMSEKAKRRWEYFVSMFDNYMSNFA